ncbi:glutathione transferase GstA [Solimicrobium silvestre]|uniref:Glutathione S-transferase n=1 Tax=Solimicrobium silvestre TaxID=2099400 RepID=A0A2S9H2G9_9BURK|nr:glutathione transferase GstA [Solimicrobium silvestre]PRC94181.1 Glutathione S-transferase [Solimicrobium silvestre]
MKLYFAPGACSLSPHIVLREAGLEHTLEKVDLRSKQTATGVDFRTINPKGYVPTLQLNDGSILTEGPVIVQYLADLVPEKHLVPKAGSMERYRVMETLNYIGTELHKGFSPLFNPATSDAGKEVAINALLPRISLIAKQLGNSDYIAGSQFTVADAYLFVVLSWSAHVKLSLADWPTIQAYLARVAERPAVHAAMVAEGLIKE